MVVVVTARIGLAACLVGLLACSAGPPRPGREVDCSMEDDYDLKVIQTMDGTTNYWFGFGDPTPGAVTTATLQPIPEGRCGNMQAEVLTAHGHHDWGAGFGEYETTMGVIDQMGYVDATGYEGISFWARTTGYGTSSGFLLSINDAQSADPMVCTVPMASDVAGGDYTYNEGGMIVPIGGELPAPNDCGNAFQRPVLGRREWYLYTLPFEEFLQTANPNRQPAGFDRSRLYSFAITMPKGAEIELWIDDLGLYRRRAPEEAAPAQANP
jgi:hypothetical protein